MNTIKLNTYLMSLFFLLVTLTNVKAAEPVELFFSQQEAVDFVENRWYSAWVGGASAVPGLLEFFTEDAIYVDPNVPEGVQGTSSLKRFFTIMLTNNPNWIFRTVNIHPTVNGLVLQWEGDIPTPTGLIRNFRGVDIFTFNEEGKIVRLEEFFDLSVFKQHSEEQ